MAYKTGTVTVTNASPTVTGSGTTWTDFLNADDLFWITGDVDDAGAKGYRILSVNTDTSITLTENYAGITQVGVNYFVSQDFTSSGFPRVLKGDIDWEAELQELADKIEEKFATVSGGGISVPKEISHYGYMVDGTEIRRNYIAKIAGSVTQVRIFCDTAPTGANAIIRVQVGTGASPASYVEVIVPDGVQTGQNTVDSFSYSIGDEIVIRVNKASDLAGLHVQIYHAT